MTTTQITVYVLPHIPAAIRAAKARSRGTNADIVYEAIGTHHDRLPALLAARRALPQPATGGLFEAQPGRAGGGRRVEAQRVPWTFKATPRNRDVLDGLVATHKAVSRSELVSVALEAMYPA